LGGCLLLAGFGKLLKQHKILGYFFHGTSFVVVILTKNRLAHILGDSFANKSGHPDYDCAAFLSPCICRSSQLCYYFFGGKKY
jgi:hypothetical protein